jgi:hypothetical protein
MYGVSTKSEDTETGEHAMWKMRQRRNAMWKFGKVRAGQVSVAPRRVLGNFRIEWQARLEKPTHDPVPGSR